MKLITRQINVEPLARAVMNYRRRERLFRRLLDNESAPESMRNVAEQEIGRARRDRFAVQALVREILCLNKTDRRDS